VRAIVADRLQEAGDPRGELIALQLAAARAPLPKAQQLRIEELVAAEAIALEAELPGARGVRLEKPTPRSRSAAVSIASSRRAGW
jgi:hypothetical protein